MNAAHLLTQLLRTQRAEYARVRAVVFWVSVVLFVVAIAGVFFALWGQHFSADLTFEVRRNIAYTVCAAMAVLVALMLCFWQALHKKVLRIGRLIKALSRKTSSRPNHFGSPWSSRVVEVRTPPPRPFSL